MNNKINASMQQWLTGNTEVREVMESLGSHSERESPDEKGVQDRGWGDEEPDIIEDADLLVVEKNQLNLQDALEEGGLLRLQASSPV